ncbi:MAG: phage tail assembly chaperone [Alphaproteobacteria bacterium]|nr:phage tail assembly chaperone [Alphaproteobacteria bacterium]
MRSHHWAAALRLAARLGLSPADFWRLSLIEWRALSELENAHTPLERQALTELTNTYPDMINE